jgi:hypothetical protein
LSRLSILVRVVNIRHFFNENMYDASHQGDTYLYKPHLGILKSTKGSLHAFSGVGNMASKSIHPVIKSCIIGCCCSCSHVIEGCNVLPICPPHPTKLPPCPGGASCGASLRLCIGTSTGVSYPVLVAPLPALDVLASLGRLSTNSGTDVLSDSKLLNSSFSHRRMMLATCCSKCCSTGPETCVAAATSSTCMRCRRVRRKCRDEESGDGDV